MPQELGAYEAAAEVTPDLVLRCRHCGHDVTHRRFAIMVCGAHEHTFRNPAGWSYRLGCFRDAPGASAHGELTAEHTWFAGHQWRYASCRHCGTHIGWWFVPTATDAVGFAGLILTRLS